MKKFDLTLEASEHVSFFKVLGNYQEKERLKKYLTVTNKSIVYQLNRVRETLDFWMGRQKSLDSREMSDKEVDRKVDFYKAQKKELQLKEKVQYYEELDDVLYIPAGFWYLFEDVKDELYKSDIEPYHLSILRDYQREAVDELLKYKRAIAVLATGGGKSLIITSLVKSLVNMGKRVFIVVPTDYLVGQLYDTIKSFHDSVTAAGGGRKSKLGCDVFVCTAQSAINHIGSYDAVIVDENQHSSAQTWQDIYAECEAEYSYAFTATNIRGDGLDLGLHAFSGPVVYEKHVKWMIDSGWLCDPNIYSYEFDTGVHIKEGSLATSAYKKMASSPKVLNFIKQQLLKATEKGRKCIVIFKTLEPAGKLQKLCKGELNFNIANATFKKPLDDFKSGNSNVLVGTVQLISEGINIPDACTLIVVSQHSSVTTTYQSVGRILRLSEGKAQPIVIDIGFTNFKQFQNGIENRRIEYHKITNNVIYMKG